MPSRTSGASLRHTSAAALAYSIACGSLRYFSLPISLPLLLVLYLPVFSSTVGTYPALLARSTVHVLVSVSPSGVVPETVTDSSLEDTVRMR